MSEIFTVAEVNAPPDRATVFERLGVPPGAAVPDRVSRLVETAKELYESLTDPRGIYEELERAEFESIYRGEGLNVDRTPLETIVARAGRLALFAVTLGEAVSRKISRLFAERDPALGYALDAIASERADTAADRAADRYVAALVNGGLMPPSTRVLPYSPGYCGWHITGQRALFRFLRPERIGITLNASSLMQPLKSVSGVFVAGPGEIHDFDDDFEFCADCATHQCRARIRSVLNGTTGIEPKESPDGDPQRDFGAPAVG